MPSTSKLQIPSPALKPVFPWVLLLCLMFFTNYTARSVLGPLLVYIEEELGLAHAQATGLMMVMSLGFAFSLALSSFVVSVIKPRLVIVISAISTGCALLAMSQGQSLLFLQGAVLCVGAATGLYFTSAMAAMGSLVGRESWSKAIAMHELAPPISFIMAPLIAEAGIRLGGSWRSALMLWGCCCIAAGIIFILLFKGGEQRTDRPSWSGIKEIFKNPVIWFFAWCFTWGIAGEFAPFNVLSLHLSLERGLDTDYANKLLASTRLLSPFAVILGGILTPRLGTRRAMQLFFGLHGLALVSMGLPSLYLALPGMFLQPLMPAFAFPAIFSILPENFPLRQHPTILGLTMPFISYLGAGLTPKILGITGDHLSFSTGFVILGCISLLSLPTCLILKSK